MCTVLADTIQQVSLLFELILTFGKLRYPKSIQLHINPIEMSTAVHISKDYVKLVLHAQMIQYERFIQWYRTFESILGSFPRLPDAQDIVSIVPLKRNINLCCVQLSVNHQRIRMFRLKKKIVHL